MILTLWRKVALFITIACALTYGYFAYFSRGDAEYQAQALDIFDRAFASKIVDRFENPLLRVRDGTEIFCIQENSAAPIPVGQLIRDLSTAFGLGWKQVYVNNLTECPKHTTYYVLHDKHLDQMKVLDMMLEIVGSAPPEPDKLFPDSNLGFTTSLPGIGNREFIFLRVRENVPDWMVRSIMSEEILQATLRASDVSTSTIVSLLGEHAVSDDYSLWFHHNPKGFCSLDIILMELLLSQSMPPHVRHMEELRDYLSSDFKGLVDAAELRGRALVRYADPRCWIWQTP